MLRHRGIILCEHQYVSEQKFDSERILSHKMYNFCKLTTTQDISEFLSRLISPALAGGEESNYMLGNGNAKKYTLKIEMPASPFYLALHLDRDSMLFL